MASLPACCFISQGNPQPIDAKMLKKVLDRNYYSAFYPSGRANLNTSVSGNAWAITCSYCQDCPLGTVAAVVPPVTMSPTRKLAQFK